MAEAGHDRYFPLLRCLQLWLMGLAGEAVCYKVVGLRTCAMENCKDLKNAGIRKKGSGLI